jgi:PAS domain S-box-containing protein
LLFKKCSSNKSALLINLIIFIILPLLITNFILVMTNTLTYQLIELGVFFVFGTILAVIISNHYYNTIFSGVLQIKSQLDSLSNLISIEKSSNDSSWPSMIQSIKNLTNTFVDIHNLNHSLIENINSGIIVVDADTNIRTFNRVAERIFNVKAADIIGKPYKDLFGSKNNQPDLLTITMLTGKSFSEDEYNVTIQNNSYSLSMFTCQLKNSYGEVMGGLATFRDITKQKQLEEEVRRSEKLAIVGELAAGTAHEIRNPLTSVKGFIQLIKTKFSPEDPAQEYINIMTSEIDRINSIIGEFLLLSKASQPSLKIMSIEQILDEIILLIESEAILKNVKIYKDYTGYSLPKVKVNTEQIKQVFLNLTTNAMAAMTQGGELNINAAYSPAERMITVRFKDNGVGIAAENLEKIFNPFFTTKETGTGLGLTVSYRIIQNHGGIMLVESEIGKGTSFTVKLPVGFEN